MTKLKEITKGAPSLEDLVKKFKDDREAVQFMLKYIYPGGKIVCPYCGNSKTIYPNTKVKSIFCCFHCGKKITIFNGTVFEGVYPCPKLWIQLFYYLFIARKSISNNELVRNFEIDYTTLAKLRRRIQFAMLNYDLEAFDGVVEMDETFIGLRNHMNYPREEEKGYTKDKYPVLGILEEKTGRTYCYVAMPNENNQCLTSGQLKAFIESTVNSGSIMVTDDFRGYNFLNKPDSGYKHEVVNHSSYKYANDNGFSTSRLEGRWTLIKKNFYGVHYGFTKKWAHLYLAESDFRYNHIDWESALDDFLYQCVLFPQVIDVRKLGRFGNKTYDLNDYRIILPECFDDIKLEDITVDDILNCNEPVYGIYKEPYQTRRQLKCKPKAIPESWKKLGMVEYGIGYKDYRNNVTNTRDDLANMIKDATKYKEVNNRQYWENRPRARFPELATKKAIVRNRKNRLKRSYNSLPKILQTQLKSEYPNLLSISNKEKSWEIHQRIRALKNWYNKNKYVIEQ